MDRLDAHFQLQRAALNARAARQEMLASNIANADTPHYKARDLDFKGALAAAMSGRGDGSVAMARTSARHLEGQGAGGYGNAVKYRTEFQPNVDGNTVNMDVERAAFAENAVQLEAALTFIRGGLKDMQLAIQGN